MTTLEKSSYLKSLRGPEWVVWKSHTLKLTNTRFCIFYSSVYDVFIKKFRSTRELVGNSPDVPAFEVPNFTIESQLTLNFELELMNINRRHSNS